ncbi:Dimethyladenosine transferase [Spraguea lophii 42_110]|uniref:rRNA adenine N(6)-methyltransferase n=1 Tax=Spraguea lophii (strain 42_110) TaxID=1358809 RepID=S7XHQ9_SPRLO|nr:Dimethyladenosine transferase [Spraguea lophii 42_110]
MSSLVFKKSLGQHILKNPGIIDSIVNKSNIEPTDTILEIGAGTGNLTLKLLEKAKKVICYEKDERLASELIKRVSLQPKLYSKLKLIVGDALKAEFPHFDMCISNIPYQISSPLIFKLLKYNFRSCVLLVQYEFAQRLVAKPGSSDYSRISVSVQLLAKVENVLKVSKKNFNPPPKVDSSVIKIKPRFSKPQINVKEFENMVSKCFLRKNKTLRSVFNTETDKERRQKIENILVKIKYDKKRSQKMCVEEFLELLLEFKKEKIDFIKKN